MGRFSALVPVMLTMVGASRIAVTPDGGYKNIVVKIDDRASEDDCPVIIRNIKRMLTESSGVLNEALGGRVYFKQATIVVPYNWKETRCQTSIITPNGNIAFRGADIKVTANSPIFGSSPFTQQSKGCGQQGESIDIPQTFFTQWNSTIKTWGNPAKLFVKEWAKFRYGIFDEFGFAGDAQYPNYFKIQDRVLPTGTSNAMLRGSWIFLNGTQSCDPTEGDCYFNPEGQNEQVTCSLGYVPFLSKVKSWCSPDQSMQPLAPSKHNVLCEGKPAIQVINENKDFAKLTGVTKLQKSLAPTFHVVRHPMPKYVLLLETSSSMAKVWKWVRKAAQNLIRYELPDDANLAIITFNNDSRVEHSMVKLSSERVRSRLADTIPDSPNKLSRSDDRCVNCGVQVAMDQVLRTQQAGGHLIIVTRGDERTLSKTDEEIIADYDKYYNIRISSILLRESNHAPLSFYSTIADRSGGRSLSVDRNAPSMQLLSDFISSLGEIIAVDSPMPANLPVTIHKKLFTRVDDTQSTLGEFTLDSTLGRETTFGVFVEDDEDHQIKSIKFTDESGGVYGPYTKMSSTFDVVNFKTINFKVGEKPPFDDAAHRGRNWKYQIDWYKERGIRNNVVVLTSKPSVISSKGLISVKTWTNFEQEVDGDVLASQPLIIYAQVLKGLSPMVNARVTMAMSVEDANGTVHDGSGGSPLLLFDNGYGDPDLVAGDGVYSRHLTQYPASGLYTFTIVVDDNDELAKIVIQGPGIMEQPASPGIPVCCGSSINIPADRLRAVGSFRRRVLGPVIRIDKIPRVVVDKVPPAKIGDLEVRMSQKQELEAAWTAPGDDYNDGQVDSYKFVYSEDISNLLSPSGKTTTLAAFKRVDQAGERVEFSIKTFKHYGRDYYIALHAVDKAGNVGRISNLVRVNIPSPPSSSTVNINSTPLPPPSTTDWTTIGALLGVFSVILLCLFIGLCCHYSRRKTKLTKAVIAASLRSSGVNADMPSPVESEKTDSSSYESDLKASSHHLVPQIRPNVSSTSFANNITPTYWSASQLLSEHEQRKFQQQDQYRQSFDEALSAIHEGVDYPEVNQYDPAYNYDYYSGQPQQYNPYSPGYDTQMYDPQLHRYSTSSVNVSDISGGHHVYSQQPNHDYNMMVEEDGRMNNNKVSSNNNNKLLVQSDISSSTLGITNPSLQGSLLSLNDSVRQGSVISKARNITQV